MYHVNGTRMTCETGLLPYPPEITPPFFILLCEAKVGRGHLFENSISLAYMPPSLAMLHARSAIATTAATNGSFEHCDACGDTKPRGIKALSVVTGDNPG